MRKGADCLSKWVGEAERQLRLLFDEARACQPSIIFFDEIDGLAPVRSSKQDQIHASIVSTLLALMDGMDGRGQVVVIGATNRPDAVDPALRRPGRSVFVVIFNWYGSKINTITDLIESFTLGFRL
jgi:SpoVK/Ycf46/Vps4 family AAA+-type ATPase